MLDWYDVEHKVRYDPTLPALRRCAILANFVANYGTSRLSNFVETGTANGQTCEYLHGLFENLYTIEIVPSVFEQTKQKLAALSNVECFLGDSTDILPPLLKRINEPCMFWLDGHYCGSLEARGPKDTPVQEELEIILATGIPHVIFVDDARLFGVDPAYPTLEWVREIATTQDIPYSFSYENDMMRIVPV